LGVFLSGLKEHIKIPLRSHCPKSLVQAYSLARNYDTTSQKKPIYDSSRWTSRASYPGKPISAPQKKDPTDEKQPTANKWEEGKCYKCQEPWITSHGRVCKFRNQIHLIAIEDDDQEHSDTEELQHDTQTITDDTNPQLQISMHALSGTSSKALFVYIGSTKLLALIDSGSTTTFLDPSVIDRIHITITNHPPLKVTVANGSILWT
jgi:hypothetical protein